MIYANPGFIAGVLHYWLTSYPSVASRVSNCPGPVITSIFCPVVKPSASSQCPLQPGGRYCEDAGRADCDEESHGEHKAVTPAQRAAAEKEWKEANPGLEPAKMDITQQVYQRLYDQALKGRAGYGCGGPCGRPDRKRHGGRSSRSAGGLERSQ